MVRTANELHDKLNDVPSSVRASAETTQLLQHDLEESDRKKNLRLTSFKEPSLLRKAIIFMTSFGIFIIFWELAAHFSGNSAILAGPYPVFLALIKLLQFNSSTGAQGLESANGAIMLTLETAVLGFCLSLAVGIPIGIIEGLWKAAGAVISPWINATHSIPMVALIPVLYFAIGGGFFADVFVSFALSVFTIIVNTQSGVRYMSNSLAEVGKTFGASEAQFIKKIVLPSTLPDIVAGMRIGIGRALLGAVMAEAFFGKSTGLGGMMMTFEQILDTPGMMAVIVLIAVIGILLLQAPKILENRLFRWKETERLSRNLEK